ncbi:MAG: FAD:protein FMN transferase [Tissierellia bacterium]|nr:FAD:protein FMN transferase [Tissierellia bacterium]
MKRVWIITLLCFLGITGCAQSKKTERMDMVFYEYFDTIIEVTCFGDPEERDSLEAELKEEIEKYNHLLNGFDSHGVVAQINAKREGHNKELEELISRTLENEEKTGRITDISRGELFSLWREALDRQELPSEEAIHHALQSGGQIRLDDGIYLQDRVLLDVGSICKGYLNDRLVPFLQSKGMENFIINSGGNVTVHGTHPQKNRKFSVGIQNPFDPNGVADTLYVENASVVTSGDYERFAEIDGRLYHHIIDLFTGYPATNGKRSVTIVGPEAYLCDFLSTVIFLTEDDSIDQVMEQYPDYMYYIVYENKSVLHSDELKEVLKSYGATGQESLE